MSCGGVGAHGSSQPILHLLPFGQDRLDVTAAEGAPAPHEREHLFELIFKFSQHGGEVGPQTHLPAALRRKNSQNCQRTRTDNPNRVPAACVTRRSFPWTLDVGQGTNFEICSARFTFGTVARVTWRGEIAGKHLNRCEKHLTIRTLYPVLNFTDPNPLSTVTPASENAETKQFFNRVAINLHLLIV